ncbi:MAG TPA: mandelate racemase/muconate lactonizing enzyme family protein [Candidatus Limnocylindria bacterium]|nr:mandelate racemase/muconate lactonizing enzyme family protein [Candidatus Limnocylindria bacterium]
MRLEKLETWVLEAEGQAIEFGAGAYSAYKAMVVAVTTDDGVTGWGECIARRAPKVLDSVVRDLLWPVAKGRDPRDVEGLWDDMFRTLRPWGHYRGFVQEGMSGIDCAVWDILAQSQQVPLYKALGGAGRAKVPVYGSKVYTAEIGAMVEQASEWVGRGHRAIKIQLGRSPERGGYRSDIEVTKAIRAAVGPAIDIGADVNSAYDAATAIKVCHEIAKYDLAFLEEPVYPDDIDGYELIRRSSPVPLAAGESEFGIFGFRELLARRAIDIVQPDVARIGGHTAAKRLGALVHAHNVRYAPHTGFSCGLAQLHSIHLAAAAPNLWRLEEMWIDNPITNVFVEDFPRSRDGVLTVPSAPGIGLGVDRRKLDRFRM